MTDVQIIRERGSLPIVELFGPTLQGEGVMIGKITHFIRFGGCDYKCSWCDSMHAVDPKQVKMNSRWLMPEDIVEELYKMKAADWVTLTGGNPGLFDLEILVTLLHDKGFKIAVETQGSVYKNWMENCDVVTISPKGPSSGMMHMNTDEYNETLRSFIALCKVNFKIVVFNDEDLLFAMRTFTELNDLDDEIKWYLSIGTRPKDTADDILKRWRDISEGVMTRWPSLRKFAILPQGHVLLWGHERNR